jgi:sarcosine oxidase/L-pipecolate oxidase
MAPSSYLIVGGGVFGASTAYHLSQAHPEASIVLVDRSSSFPCPLAASEDYNKIIRADYGSIFYCELALKAREAWKTDPLYKDFYHETGMVVMDESDLGQRIIKNYETLKAYSESIIIGSDEMKTRYNGLFSDTDYRGVKDIFVNPLSGWAEAATALKKVIEAAISNGVKYVQGDIDALVFDRNGDCTGVKTKDGRVLSTEKVILSTGAGTAQLLADSAPDRHDLQVEDRITASAVVTGIVMLNEEQMKRFEKAPIFIHSVGEVQGANHWMMPLYYGTNISAGEVLPPRADGLLKFCVDVSFKNTSLHPKSGQTISAPPDQPDQAQHFVSQRLQDECSRVVRGIYGKKLANAKFDSFRICCRSPIA